MMDIEELTDNFSFCETWEERYGYIIDLGSKLENLDAQFKTPQSARLSVAGVAGAGIQRRQNSFPRRQ